MTSVAWHKVLWVLVPIALAVLLSVAHVAVADAQTSIWLNVLPQILGLGLFAWFSVAFLVMERFGRPWLGWSLVTIGVFLVMFPYGPTT